MGGEAQVGSSIAASKGQLPAQDTSSSKKDDQPKRIKTKSSNPSNDNARKSRSWEALTPPLSEWILRAINSPVGLDFARMTPVQASTIPLFTGNKDVVVEAVTGSGKTLAFLIPILERLLRLEEPLKKHHVGAIVISPTRELATQIYEVLMGMLSWHGPSQGVFYSTPSPNNSEEEDDDNDDDEATEQMKRDEDKWRAKNNPSALKVIPQLLVGGKQTPKKDLAQFLQNSPNLLISTPGRLLELLSSPYVHCPQSSFEVLVLDEADRLLDLGFKDDLQKILARLPKQRRTGLFSASVGEAVDELVRVGLRNPVRIAVKVRGVGKGGEEKEAGGDLRTPASLQMTYFTTPATHKLPTLLRLIHTLQPRPLRTIAYFSTCAAVDYIQHILPSILSALHPSQQQQQHSSKKSSTSTSAPPPPPPSSSELKILSLHGRHTPQHRQKNFHRFTTSDSPTLLLTTDLAARGLDIPSVDLTVQVDPPTDPKTYLHRAGRAGRAGRKGLSVVFLMPGREADEYPGFLAVRRTPVEPFRLPSTTPDDANNSSSAQLVTESDATTSTSAIRATVLKDRTLHDKAQRAFPSSVQAYRKHEAKGIFRVAELPWGELAEGWGLLRMPRMPELGNNKRKREVGGGEEEEEKDAAESALSAFQPPDVDWPTYAYAHREKEQKRLQAQENPQTPPSQPAHKTASKAGENKNKIPFSNSRAARSEARERRDGRRNKRERRKVAKMSDGEREKAREVEGLIERVRVERRGGDGDDEFEGFD